MDEIPPHGWVVYEFTYDPRREIGSRPPFQREWSVTLDFDPMVEIERLRADLADANDNRREWHGG